MGHINGKNYLKLQKRLDAVAQGAPESDALIGILKVLFTDNEAELASKLPVSFFTVEDATKRWKVSPDEAKKELDNLADKGFLFDYFNNEKPCYFVAPTMAGFFEFALMRSDGKFNEKLLSEQLHQYLNVEDGYLNEVFAMDVPMFRIYIQENVIQDKDKTIVMDYEKVSKVIENSSFATVSTCFCRHKKEHLGEDCDAPKRTCLTFNDSARSLHKHGIAEKISKQEAYKIVDECVELGLVQLGDNIQNNVNWICNCCSCCCDGLDAYRRLGCDPKIETNFLSKHNDKECTGCGLCVKRCPVDAIKLETINGKKEAVVNSDRCIGCGVCANFCPTKTRVMVRRDETNFVPVDSFERYMLNAIDEGKLQNYIFDNRDILSHELLRRFFKIFLALPPLKMALANKQLRSRFLKILAKTKREASFDKEGKTQSYDHPELKGNKK